MREDRQPKSGVQVVLALAVQVVSVAGVLSFLVAVALSSEVFRYWSLNFLQLATTGDIIASGLDVFSRMLLPVMAMIVAGYAAWSFEFRWARWEIALSIAALALLFMFTLYYEGENTRVTAEFWRLANEGDMRSELYNVLGGRVGGIYYTALLATQVAAVFIGARFLRNMLAAMTRNPQRRALIWIAAAGMTVALLFLPWTVFRAQTGNLATAGFHNGTFFALDCRSPEAMAADEFGFDAQQAEVLWLGDRAMVVRCNGGQPQVVLLSETTAVLHQWGETPVDVTPEEETPAPPKPEAP